MNHLNFYVDAVKKNSIFSLLHRSAQKAGMSPGSAVHVGDKRVEQISITITDYNESNFQHYSPANIEECFPYCHTASKTWITITGLHDAEIINNICNKFELHPLTTEDILNTTQRPKLDAYENYAYMVVRIHSYDADQHTVLTEQVSIILGTSFVLTFQEKHSYIFDAVRKRIELGRGRIRKMGTDYLAYCLLDSVVDSYFGVFEKIGEEIELLEENLLNNPTPDILHRIHFLKREMILMRKAIWPLREVISSLQRNETTLISPSLQVYLRDLYDHTIQVIETVETFRDMISGMVEIYLSSVSNRMNEIMKVLTIFAAIFIPLTLIAGIYGMNFNPDHSPLNMPELNWYFGYPFALGLMALIGVTMILLFKKKGWF